MQTHLHIDWLSITYPVSDEKSAKRIEDIKLWNDLLGNRFTLDNTEWRVSKPMFGYTSAYISSRGTIAMCGSHQMGIHCIWSGQSLQALEAAGISPEGIIKNANNLGGRATRVDIAIDIYNGRAGVMVYKTAIHHGRCHTSSRSWRTMENGEGGQTLYIGSRASERMVRIYDKKAERAAAFVEVGADSWIRAEVELKGDRARDFLRACRDNDLTDVMQSFLVTTVDFPDITEWQEATRTSGKHVEPTETKRKTTKTRHWLMSVIAPVLARECAQDGLFLVDFQTEVHAQIEKLLSNFDDVDKP